MTIGFLHVAIEVLHLLPGFGKKLYQFLLPLFAVWFLSSFSLRRTASPRVRPFDA